MLVYVPISYGLRNMTKARQVTQMRAAYNDKPALTCHVILTFRDKATIEAR